MSDEKKTQRTDPDPDWADANRSKPGPTPGADRPEADPMNEKKNRKKD